MFYSQLKRAKYKIILVISDILLIGNNKKISNIAKIMKTAISGAKKSAIFINITNSINVVY